MGKRHHNGCLNSGAPGRATMPPAQYGVIGLPAGHEPVGVLPVSSDSRVGGTQRCLTPLGVERAIRRDSLDPLGD